VRGVQTDQVVPLSWTHPLAFDLRADESQKGIARWRAEMVDVVAGKRDALEASCG
jgi:hypothetical protein